MIVTRFETERVFYRFLTPRWSHQPLSGAGAAVNGGRFNRPGIEAVYLSTEPETALAEIRQGASIAPPATLAAYRVKAEDIADFSNGFDPAIWAAAWSGWNADWKYIARIERRTPPSLSLADDLITAGRRGLLFPSTRRAGGINLVLFPANLTVADRIAVHDPHGELPVDQSSWPAPAR
ncbi:RES family NAD+ phosphorylase [uncultured Methylobacterium sp.]|uniref:RES family NAD+ phosphorylase n=1 Tax=uncultured Methylobacterium sp. TaxID=157278 RepID=UPI00262A768A|nr:RES family NAD+ phosphorylase [uncultured Methylobacterium sp.]